MWKKRKKDPAKGEEKLLLQELKENPYQKFEIAFALMTIIPFLVFIYILAARLFTFSIFIGDIGLVLLISLTLSFLGYLLGYRQIKESLDRVVYCAVKAKEGDELKSRFVATVSHELRNPLFVLSAHIKGLFDGTNGQTTEEQKETLGTCRRVLDRMSSLVGSLIDIYKIEAGMVKLHKKLCDVTELADRQFRELDIMIKEKDITAKKDISGKEQYVWGDEGMVTQVINNLLSNAIKYTPENGSVILKVFPSEGFLRLEFKDTGQGIPADKLEKVFDKFERLDRAQKGVGLGLAIAKDIVKLHDGRIWAESQPGEGSTFIVILPRRPKA